MAVQIIKIKVDENELYKKFTKDIAKTLDIVHKKEKDIFIELIKSYFGCNEIEAFGRASELTLHYQRTSALETVTYISSEKIVIGAVLRTDGFQLKKMTPKEIESSKLNPPIFD